MSFSVSLQIAKSLASMTEGAGFTLKLTGSAGFPRDFHGRLIAFSVKFTQFRAVGMSLIVNPYGRMD
jgi:hypothetical protein